MYFCLDSNLYAFVFLIHGPIYFLWESVSQTPSQIISCIKIPTLFVRLHQVTSSWVLCLVGGFGKLVYTKCTVWFIKRRVLDAPISILFLSVFVVPNVSSVDAFQCGLEKECTYFCRFPSTSKNIDLLFLVTRITSCPRDDFFPRMKIMISLQTEGVYRANVNVFLFGF